MRTAFIALLLLSAPAQAAIQFKGHGASATGCIARCDWSSDLGPDYVASRPFALNVNGLEVFADTSRNLTGGPVSSQTRVRLAPAGPVNAASGPVFVFDGSGLAVNGGDLYGRTYTTSHTACVNFTPPGAGQTVHWALKWRLRKSQVGAVLGSVRVASAAETFLQGTQADSGIAFRTSPGTTGSLCFDMEQEWGVGSGSNGSIVGDLHVEIFLDSAPLVDVESWTETRLTFDAPRPNPARARAQFDFSLPRAGDVTIDIVDIAGRMVAEMHAASLPAGPHTLPWQAVGLDGEPLGSGVYFARLRLDGSGIGALTRRIVLVE